MTTEGCLKTYVEPWNVFNGSRYIFSADQFDLPCEQLPFFKIYVSVRNVQRIKAKYQFDMSHSAFNEYNDMWHLIDNKQPHNLESS